MHGKPTDSHYRCFLLAIVAQAVEDARLHLAGRPCIEDRHRTAGPEAVKWLESTACDVLCSMADLDPEALADAVRTCGEYDGLAPIEYIADALRRDFEVQIAETQSIPTKRLLCEAAEAVENWITANSPEDQGAGAQN